MTNLEQVLYDLVKPMVDHPDVLTVKEAEGASEREIVLHVNAEDEDIARLIGRKGSMASALRQVMSVAAHKEEKKVTIKFGESAE